MNEDEKVAAEKEKAERKIQKLAGAVSEREQKIELKDKELDEREQKIKRLEKENQGLSKRVSGRVAQDKGLKIEQMAVDGVGSIGGQLGSLGLQTLLDYMIEKFPDSIGKHAIVAKTIPPSLAGLWYLIELATLNKQAKLPKKMRLEAAKLLTNLGFVYLGQTYWRSQGEKKADAAQMGQDHASMAAKLDKVQEELQKAREQLKAAGIKPKE